jgi:murein DD-endopeptidase MepM/ murein hydrolase activator NlpD
VTKGTKIAKGQAIGTVGKSDPEMEPHLHFEMRPGQRAVDPLEWLRSRK